MRTEIDAGTAVAHLAVADPRLGGVIERVGAFTMRPDPEEPFHSLLRAITYQQLSGKATATIFSRFLGLFGGLATSGERPAKVSCRIAHPHRAPPFGAERSGAAVWRVERIEGPGRWGAHTVLAAQALRSEAWRTSSSPASGGCTARAARTSSSSRRTTVGSRW